jgi:beta-xylosidase
VAKRKGGSLCVAAATANKPTGPYEDHGPLKCQQVGSIDPFPIRDENGKFFLVWKEDGNSVGQPTPIWAQELDTSNWKLIGEQREILRNDPATWEGTLIEGPFIMRKNGYFYLFYSGNFCCGRGCNYAVGVARSLTLLGNWEKYQENPILKGNENWNCPGHGSIVTNEGGRTYFIYHAYHPTDTNYVGRQALLDEVTWTADGWARINNGSGPSKRAASPLGVAERNEEYNFFDDFNAPTLRLGWQWLQNNIPTYRIANGFLELSPNTAVEKDPIGGIMAYWTTRGNYRATTMLETAGLKRGEMAGIAAYGDGENSLGAGVQDGKVQVWRRERNQFRALWTADAPRSAQLYLRMTARNGLYYDFAVSSDGRTFRPIGFEQNGDYLPPWDRGVRVALTVGGTENASARFAFLRIEPTK